MWNKNEYKINFRDDSILDFERVMLSSGECNYLFPMYFIGGDTNQTAYYDCRGFTPLSMYRVDRTEDAFFILEKVIMIMSCVVEYLISPTKVMLNLDTVFFNSETGEIKIAYVPLSDEKGDIRRNLLLFISQLKTDINDGYSMYLDRFAREVNQNSYRLLDLTNKLGLLRRELYEKSTVTF